MMSVPDGLLALLTLQQIEAIDDLEHNCDLIAVRPTTAEIRWTLERFGAAPEVIAAIADPNDHEGRRRAPPLPEHLIWDLEPGLHADGCGLYLRVQQSGSRSWVLIDFEAGRRRERGLGGARRVSLSEARVKAAALRRSAAAERSSRQLGDTIRQPEPEPETLDLFAGMI